MTEDYIKSIVLEVLEESDSDIANRLFKRLREGDEDSDDDNNDTDDGTVDDAASGDMGDLGDAGFDDDGAGGNDGEDSKPSDPEKGINELSDNVNHGFNAPKNLVLNDGTETHIAVDSGDQVGEVDQDTSNYEISFEKGNWNIFAQSAQLYSQKVTVVRQTLVPLIEKALIELLETSGAYDRTSFSTSAYFQNDDFRVFVELHYTVDLWLGSEFSEESVMHDQGYIYQTISVVPGIQIESVNIDTSKGDVQIIASV